MRKGDKTTAQRYVDLLKQQYPKHELTELVADPYYFTNAQRGEHIEDSLYATTYDAFKAENYDVVRCNAKVSATKFKHGANRDKFLFVEALSMLHGGNIDGCLNGLQTLVEHFPQSELSKMAAMIVNGIKAGRRVQAGGFDLNNVWQRRTAATNAADSLKGKQFSNDRNANFLFVMAYQPDSINENLLLFALDSLAIAAQALLGKELGERDLTAESGRAKVRELKNRLVRMSLVYGVVTGVVAPVIGFFGNWIFTQDAPVATLFAWATLVIGVGQPIAAYVFVLDGILMGAQDVKYLAIGSFVMLVVYAPVIFGIHWAVSGGLLSATVGYLGLWAAYILWYQGVRAFIFGRRAASDVWIKA